MTKKDYIALAAAIRAEVDASCNKHGHTYHYQIAVRIANVCASENARFDRDRFLKACGVTP